MGRMLTVSNLFAPRQCLDAAATVVNTAINTPLHVNLTPDTQNSQLFLLLSHYVSGSII